MAVIFNRPMFRRGGSVAEGTGITYGLPRAKYEEGSDENGVQQEDVVDTTEVADIGDSGQIEIKDISEKYKNVASKPTQTSVEKPEVQDKYVNQSIEKILEMVQDKLMPTDQEKIQDYMTALAAAGSGDPTKLQTWGSFLGKAAANYSSLQEPKIKAAKQYGAQAALQVIKGMNKSSLTALMKNAQAGVDAGYYKDINEGIRKQLEGQEYGKKESPEKAKRLIVNQYTQDFLRADKDDTYARDKAEMEYMIRNEKRLPSGITSADFASKKYLKPNQIMEKDGKLVWNPSVVSKGTAGTFKGDINKVFINPVTGKFYRYKGDYFEPIV